MALFVVDWPYAALASSPSANATRSPTVQIEAVTPSAMAGVLRIVLWPQQRLYQQTKVDGGFVALRVLLNALVSRVNRQAYTRTVSLLRSTQDVLRDAVTALRGDWCSCRAAIA